MKKYVVKINKIVKGENSETNMYHCCSWCHFFTDGKCYQNFVYKEEKGECSDCVYKVAEDGHLHEALEESLHSLKFPTDDLVRLLRKWGVSEKRVSDFNKTFNECMVQFIDMTVIPKLDEDVSTCYQNWAIEDSKDDGLEISDPENFSCEKWC